jgi:hypothetical protein
VTFISKKGHGAKTLFFYPQDASRDQHGYATRFLAMAAHELTNEDLVSAAKRDQYSQGS